MGFFTGRKPPARAPQGAQLEVDSTLDRGPPRLCPRPAPSVFELGTALVEGRAASAPPTPSPPPAHAAVVERILWAYRSTQCGCAVDASRQDVDALVAANQLDLVNYCATHANDREVQRYALDQLAKARRFFDVFEVAKDHVGEGHTHARYVLSLFEREVDAITSGDMVSDRGDNVCHLMDFVLERTADLEVARKLIAWAKIRGDLDLPVQTRNKEVRKLIVEAQEEGKQWNRLFGDAMYLFAMMHVEPWQQIMAVFDRHAEEIVAADREQPIQRDSEGILVYIGRNTESCDVGRQMTDALAGKKGYSGIKEIAATADNEYKIVWGGKVRGRIPRQNAEEIARYALGTLHRAGRIEELQEVAATAALESVQAYARELSAQPLPS